LELPLACDFRVAGPPQSSASQGGLGIVPSSGGLYRVTRALGPLAARELVVLGRRLDAKEALAHGLVTGVVDDPDPLSRTLALAKELAALAPLAVACRAIDRIGGPPGRPRSCSNGSPTLPSTACWAPVWSTRQAARESL
jgi:enoyl-CoA hydratase/carnithine racemase